MPAIRRQVHIVCSPRAAWRALTTAEGLEKWLADDARIDGRKGGRVVLSGTGFDAENEARGIVHTWRPTAKFEVAWDSVGQFEGKSSHFSFVVARDGDETRVSIVHSGGEALDDEERREKLDVVWKDAFATLQALLDD
jgi:uncharacterized protein YndB with AHSA1/START domain